MEHKRPTLRPILIGLSKRRCIWSQIVLWCNVTSAGICVVAKKSKIATNLGSQPINCLLYDIDHGLRANLAYQESGLVRASRKAAKI